MLFSGGIHNQQINQKDNAKGTTVKTFLSDVSRRDSFQLALLPRLPHVQHDAEFELTVHMVAAKIDRKAGDAATPTFLWRLVGTCGRYYHKQNHQEAICPSLASFFHHHKLPPLLRAAS
jgi:hypothetical protein